MLRSPYFSMVQVTFGLLLLCDDNHGIFLILSGSGSLAALYFQNFTGKLVAVGLIAQLVSGISDAMGLNAVHPEFFSGLILHNCLSLCISCV